MRIDGTTPSNPTPSQSMQHGSDGTKNIGEEVLQKNAFLHATGKTFEYNVQDQNTSNNAVTRFT